MHSKPYVYSSSLFCANEATLARYIIYRAIFLILFSFPLSLFLSTVHPLNNNWNKDNNAHEHSVFHNNPRAREQTLFIRTATSVITRLIYLTSFEKGKSRRERERERYFFLLLSTRYIHSPTDFQICFILWRIESIRLTACIVRCNRRA